MTPDEKYMRMALNLALKGRGMTSPNPAVGAVVVHNGRVVGKGYHKGPGQLHAEAVAIREGGSEVSGATLYVNLEPCCHTDKRTPPCTREIIRSGVKRVVAGMTDPNPLVSGRGFRELADAGITVEKDVLRGDAIRMNEIYSKFITSHIPFVILKSAASLDGKIALASGESRWITGQTARRYAHRLRSVVDAVLVGVGTVISDDPVLSVRHVRSKGRQPLRVIVDSRLRIPLKSKVLDTRTGQQTMVVTTGQSDEGKLRELEGMGIKTVIADAGDDGRVDLRSLIIFLGKSDVTGLLIEGGSEMNASALRSGVVDKVVFIYSARIIGGRDSVGIVGGHSPKSLDESIFLKDVSIRRTGEDIIVEGYIR